MAAVLVDHVEELEAPSIGGGVELKVHGPDLVRMLGLMTTYEAVSRPGPLLFAGSRALEPLLSPEPVQLLVVHRPAFPPQQAVGNAALQEDVLSRDFAEASTAATR